MLIVRIGAMGDVLHALPAVAALKQMLPECWVGWVVEPRWLPLLTALSGGPLAAAGAAIPLVDQSYLAATREWKRRPISRETFAEIASLKKGLREGRFDVCVDMQGSIRSAVIGRMAGAGEFAGPAAPREAPAQWLYGKRIDTFSAHVIEQGCELLGGALGMTLEPARVDFPVDEATERTCDAMLARLLPEGGPFALVAPTAGWGAKQWPAERFGSVAAELGRRGYRTLVNAAGENDPIAQSVVAASEGYSAAASGSLSQLIALTRRASVVIAGDTGPLHLAAALGRPVVALFGPTDPARNGPYGTRAKVLRHGQERRNHKRLDDPEAGLLEITVDEVVNAAMDLLDGAAESERGKVRK